MHFNVPLRAHSSISPIDQSTIVAFHEPPSLDSITTYRELGLDNKYIYEAMTSVRSLFDDMVEISIGDVVEIGPRRSRTVGSSHGDLLLVRSMRKHKGNGGVYIRGERFVNINAFAQWLPGSLQTVVAVVHHTAICSVRQPTVTDIHCATATELVDEVVELDWIVAKRTLLRTTPWMPHVHPETCTGCKADFYCAMRVCIIGFRERPIDENSRTGGSNASHDCRELVIQPLRESERDFTPDGHTDADRFVEWRYHRRTIHGRRFPSYTLAVAAKTKYTFGDAFCGAGGASKGAKLSGFSVEWGFDSDGAAINSYKANINPRQGAQLADVSMAELSRVDHLHLSPPCQPLSPINRNKRHVGGQRWREQLATLGHIGTTIERARPRTTTVEETFGIAQTPWWQQLSLLVMQHTEKGFSIRMSILNASDYGSGQSRNRLIIMGACPGQRLPSFPRHTHGPGTSQPYCTAGDHLSRLLLSIEDDELPPYDAVKRRRLRKLFERYTLRHSHFRTIIGSKLSIALPGGLVYGLSFREQVAFQGLEGFKFCGNSNKRWKQVGNAVIPDFFRQIMDEVMSTYFSSH